MADAKWLEKAARLLRRGRLVAIGVVLEQPGEDDEREVLVGGRATIERARYRVVTTQHLAAAVLPEDDDVVWTPLPEVTLRGALLTHLERTPREVDPRDALEDQADDWVWVIGLAGDARFAGTSVSNPARYEASALNRADSVTFGFEGSARADADIPGFLWENSGTTRYRTTRTVGEGSEFIEGEDLLSARSTLQWRGLRGPDSPWTVPNPFAELYLETELTVPDTRDFRHLLMRTTGGLQWPVRDELTLKLHAGAEKALLDPEGEWRPGVGAQLRLLPWTILDAGDRRIQIEADADYFVAGPFADDVQTLRASIDATFDLAASFAVVIGMDAYVQRVGDQDPGIGIDATAGVRLRWLERGVFR
jgi:hypothetical protein